MHESLCAAVGEELRREPTRGAAARWRCEARWVVVVVAVLGLSAAASGQTPTTSADDLPDAPSAQMTQTQGSDGQSQVEPSDGSEKPEAEAMAKAPPPMRPCRDSDYVMEKMPLQGPPPCIPENQISPFVTSGHAEPLSSKQKATLALRDFLDPFNFVTIAGYSAIAIAENSHSAYGSGMRGVATLTGYGLAEDAQGEFLQTYAIPSLLHQDPRYHRVPTASVKHRIWHAVEHTYVSQHDDGRKMPNYATLLTYPLSAELSNLYVPGLQRDAKSTARRVAIGIATDPTGALTAEFLPDVARHIHINIRFIQNILNSMATGAPSVTSQ